MAGTITSANAVFTLTVPGVFPNGFQLQGFAAERAWQSDAQEVTESRIGVDGLKASGWVPAMVSQTVSLLPNSSSRQAINAIIRAQEANRDAIILQGTIVLTSTGESFNCINGTIKNAKKMPDAAKTLQDTEFVIEWQNIKPTVI